MMSSQKYHVKKYGMSEYNGVKRTKIVSSRAGAEPNYPVLGGVNGARAYFILR